MHIVPFSWIPLFGPPSDGDRRASRAEWASRQVTARRDMFDNDTHVYVYIYIYIYVYVHM